MRRDVPLLRGLPLAKGFICGSLLAGAIAVPYGILVQLALLVIAAMVFIDTSCVFGRERHILSFSALLALGLVLGLLSAVISLISTYMLFVFIAMTVLYVHEYLEYRKG